MASSARASRHEGRWRRLLRGAGLILALASWALTQPVGASTPGDAPAPGPLVQPAQLQALLRQHVPLRIVDLRDPDAYAAGHLPGAVNAPYADWRGDASNPGKLLPVPRFTQLVRSLGLHASDTVVLVSDGGDPSDFGAPARVYWTLKWLGMRQLSILNGGMKSWQDSGFGGLQRVAVKAAPSDFQPRLDDALLATRAQVRQLVDREQGRAHGAPVLLDARPPAFWQGKAKAPAALQPGTLAGSVDFNNLSWFPQGTGALPDIRVLRAIASGLPGAEQQASGTVSFCNTGHWAATNWFVLSELLHRPGVRLYPGSMVDWSRHDEPMTHVPSRIDQLWAQLKQTWQAR
ncbi:MAG: sulfurtransferase [Betaproteobacteria bacterium]|nr:sulfurtransferase [Betaproteobacteria bacterium]